MSLVKFILFFVFAVSYSASQCQNKAALAIKRCAVKTINFEQGLINNTTTDVITDGMGLTWVSALTGLQRFNGNTLEKITPVINNDTVHINYPVFFLATKNGTVLIGYKKGVLEYSPVNNAFTKKISLSPLANLHYSLIPIKETSEGLWCLQENKGVMIYNDKGVVANKFASAETSSVDSLFYSRDILYKTLIASNDDFIFLRSSVNRILQINIRTHEFKYLMYGKEVIFGLACNRQTIFVGSATGLLHVNINDGSISDKFLYNTLTPEHAGTCNIQLTNNNQLLVSVGKHLYEFDTLGVFSKEYTSLNREPIIGTGYIIKAYEDRLKRIWLLTNDDLKRIQDIDIPFGHFLYPNEKNNFVRAIYLDEEKHLVLAGCFNGGIQLYDTLGNALWDKPLITEEIKDILFIEKLTRSDYLIVTLGRGWYILSLPDKKLQAVYFNSSDSYQKLLQFNGFSNTLQRIDDSTILISAYSNVFRCKTEKGKITSIVPLLNDSNNFVYPISCFTYASDKTLWIASTRGLLYRVRQKEDIKSIAIPENYIVRCMMEDAKHDIWVGTEKGLFIYSARGKIIKQITKESGLLNDFIYALLPVDSNTVFASTNMGLSLISKEGLVKNYTKELGLQENEFNTQAAVRSSTGKLFFGGINGITAFYPGALSGFTDTTIINITRLVVNDSLYNSSAGIWKGDSIQLEYYQNHLQFDITAIGLLDPNEYVYHYRLKEFEELWQTAHEPIALRYTLEPGEYLLEITCSPLLSPNTIFSKKIVVIINAPWWQTWWFRAIAFAVLVVSVALIVLQYNRQKYQKKIRLLQLQNEIQNERERISKELHDNIGTQLSYISSNVDWMLEAPIPLSREEETNRLSAVNTTAKEMISDLRETIWAIKKESILLDELADKLKLFIQSQRILKPGMEINISEDIGNNIRFSPTEALNIFRICQEAIVNSIKHSGATKLNAGIHSNADQPLLIIIEDNGNGFIQDKEYAGHYGLENMRGRAAELGANLEIISEKGKGTRILLSK